MGEDDLGGFGDVRLRGIGSRLLAAMREAPTMCVHALAETRNEAVQFGRFLDNAAVSADEMLVHAGRQTGIRLAGLHVLAIQDTTELHFASHTGSKHGFGAGGNGHDPGLFLHPVIAVDACSGGVIGLVGTQVLNRTSGKTGDHKLRDPEVKESRRWLAGAETAASVLADAATITVVGDRESDIYDQFARRPASVHLLSRAAQNRTLATPPRLFDTCTGWPERDRYTITVPARGSRPARPATVAVRWGEVTLTRPTGAPRSLPPTVTLSVVDVAEIDASGPSSVHWCLLTTHTVTNLGHAREIVRWYQARWTIEQVFRTLKSAGAQAETSQVTQPRRFVKLAVTALIAAVRIVQIVIGRDAATGQRRGRSSGHADAPGLQR